MEPDDCSRAFSSVGNVLIWAPTSGACPNNELLYTPSSSQRRRASFTDKHPLLAKLEEAEEDLKHCDYTAHLLIQQRTREYAFAVEDTIVLLKKGTEQIVRSLAYWRGCQNLDDLDEHSYLTKIIGEVVSGSLGNEDITRVGKMIVRISETVKSLQDEDALTFWTCDQREILFKRLVSVSRDTVKLRRKLGRIKTSLGERLKGIRRIAILCECEITGNLVPSEIYYQWVKEDSKWCRGNLCNDIAMANASEQNISEQNPIRRAIDSIKKAAINLLTCTEFPMNETLTKASTSSETDSDISTVFTTPLKLYPQKSSSQKIDVKILHKQSEEKIVEENSVCNTSLENIVGALHQYESKLSEVEVWSPKPSQKYVDLITANIAAPQKFATNAYIYDHNESRIKEDPTCLETKGKYLLSSSELEIFDECENKIDMRKSNLTKQKDRFVVEAVVLEPRVLSNNNAVTSHNEDPLETECNIVCPEPSVKSSPSTSLAPNTSSASSFAPTRGKRFLSETMQNKIFLVKNLCKDMTEVVSDTTWDTRSVERMWLSPPEDLVKHRKSPPTRELYKLVEFIVDTAKLTQKFAFASRIYPEDKHEIISVLDPVLRELTNCYMSVYVLHNLVVIDTTYLKELVNGFPKGNLVIRDWLSDPSIDDELEGEDQAYSTLSEYDIDINDLFQ